MNLANFIEALESVTTNMAAEVIFDDHGSFRSLKDITTTPGGTSVVIVLEPHGG